MITTIRRHQRWLLLLVAIMTIIAFAWLYNTTDTEKLGENQVAQMYGKTVYRPEVDRVVRLQQLAAILGMEEFLRSLTVTAQSEEGVLEEFVWNLLVLRHQAAGLYLQPADEQVLEAIRGLPALQVNGQFDRARYADLLQSELVPRGLTERHLEELIRDSLRLTQLRTLLGSPLQLGVQEENDIVRGLEKIDAQLIEFGPLTGAEAPVVTDEEVASFFQENAASLQTPAYRKVAYVKLGLNPEQAALEGRPRIEALQAVADQIARFAENAAAGEGFATAAEAAGLTVVESPFFDARGSLQGADPSAPGAPVELPPSVVTETFRLSEPRRLGEIVQDGDNFYVVDWKEEIAPRPLTEEEIAPRIREMLGEQKAGTMAQLQAEAMRGALEKQLTEGKSLEELAAVKGLKITPLQGLEPWSQTMDENATYARMAADLDPGQISPVSRNAGGFYVLQVTARQAPSAELLATEGARLRADILEGKQLILFADWLRASRAEAGLKFFQTGS